MAASLLRSTLVRVSCALPVLVRWDGGGEVVPGVCWISLPLRSSLRLVPEDYQFSSGLCAFTNLKFRLLYRDVGGGEELIRDSLLRVYLPAVSLTRFPHVSN